MWRVDVVGVALALGSCERDSEAESQSSQRSRLLGRQGGPLSYMKRPRQWPHSGLPVVSGMDMLYCPTASNSSTSPTPKLPIAAATDVADGDGPPDAKPTARQHDITT